MNNIYLVGFMGTGKTSTGKELARRLKRQFVDLDNLIELKEKRPIPDIFAKDGEPEFRRLEKEALKDIVLKDEVIVACGGGIVIDRDNIRLMKETGLVICLSASSEVVLNRTSKYSHRPLLNVPEPKKQIASLLSQRQPFYALADQTIDTSKLSVAQTAEKIIEILSKNGPA